jgi:hypothetical protein
MRGGAQRGRKKIEGIVASGSAVPEDGEKALGYIATPSIIAQIKSEIEVPSRVG